MSALLKEILALTVKSEAALWKGAEQKVLSGLNNLAKTELVQITHHFGVNKQGSEALWSQLDKAAVGAFPELSVDETLQLIDGFGECPDSYTLSHDLNQRLLVSWEQLGKLNFQKLKETNPYFASDIVNQLDAAAAEFIKVRPAAESEAGGFLNSLGVSSSFNTTKNDIYVVQSASGKKLNNKEQREAYVLEKAQKYLKEDPQSKILDIIAQK
uniref:COXTT27 n=1 Tax=Tetrahymena thermophila (strain SB210) TaxID=312017 RepID=UPI0023F596F5|nr:Chain EC, COXTT27 [Tetrahymena thermophila SB210]8B6H_Ec Chain Ec, COXTT27 [Tetrahymena thermophila SB210]8BQS_EC Chain EC, COXTT27 [Tetrahymena thermophila SB210]8BQS_Ec Chain Ec, COXTT27 [Tetrahymena thermophila SB210]8GYM_C Chain C, COXTT3 [Tetrahymena thermophila SB210]8GYM_c Chain c, COXTT3 [Tetrahymena thermophila SB210]8GZU_02 Chain 02, COXTT3 [Tetrahymena thermophila SB210]8GZU_57 Chain 57, COXTT3 [Tetrahymena thermophila SB210]8GZU_C Chain C, COXTT3 [Tetrahymena thermophila SB21